MTALKINSTPWEKSAIAYKLRICCQPFCKLIDEEKYSIILMKFPFNQFTLVNKEMGEKLSKGPC